MTAPRTADAPWRPATATRSSAWLRLAATAAAGGLALVLALLATTGVGAQQRDLPLPEVIRVLLSDVGDTLTLEPQGPATAVVDGRSRDIASGQRIVVGRFSRFLAFPAQAAAPWALEIGLDGPVRAAEPSLVHLGPYVDLAVLERHRRLLRTEAGVGVRMLPPRPTLAVGDWATLELPARLDVRPVEPHAATRLNGTPYRGGFDIRRVDGGFLVVNHVGLADYLASVVGAEMPRNWEIEALKAQAVAARTYAIQHLQPSEIFDICDNQNCQAYGGMRSESERTQAAVAATAGVVAMFNGAPIEALYSANAGDITESSEHVWGTPVPYLRSVPSPGDAAALTVSWGAEGYRWTRTIPLAELADYRAFRNGGVGAIVDLRVLERTPAGRPLRILVVGAAGEVELFGDDVRTALGLPSAFVELELAPLASLELIGAGPRRFGALLEEGHRITSVRRSIAFAAAPPDIALVNGAVHVAVFERPPALVLTGRGFGHGLGMSQWGAQGMALAGHTYDEILTHYYTGIELRDLS